MSNRFFVARWTWWRALTLATVPCHPTCKSHLPLHFCYPAGLDGSSGSSPYAIRDLFISRHCCLSIHHAAIGSRRRAFTHSRLKKNAPIPSWSVRRVRPLRGAAKISVPRNFPPLTLRHCTVSVLNSNYGARSYRIRLPARSAPPTRGRRRRGYRRAAPPALGLIDNYALQVTAAASCSAARKYRLLRS